MKKKAVNFLVPLIVGILVFCYLQGWFNQKKTLGIDLQYDFGYGRVLTVEDVEYEKPLFRDGTLVVTVDFHNGGDETSCSFVGYVAAYQKGIELSQYKIKGYDDARYTKIKNGAHLEIKTGFELIDNKSPVEIVLKDWIGTSVASGACEIK